MSSRLESLPCDILQHIAFLSASASTLDPLVPISCLLQASSSLYRALNIHEAPDLYAHLFTAKFDRAAISRRYPGQITDSAMAGELVNRCRLLRRARRSDFSSTGLLQDLWTALWMLLENDGRNMQQLSAVNFADFILGCSRTVLRPPPPIAVDHRTDDKQDLKDITVWLLCLSLRRRVILDMSTQDRDALYGAIVPFVFLSNKVSEALPSAPLPLFNTSDRCRHAYGPPEGPHYLRSGEPSSPFSSTCSSAHNLVSAYLIYSKPSVPDPSTAAINLISVILEATPMKAPYHLPETRAIANANQRSGPTQDDYRIITSHQTFLFADHARVEPEEQVSLLPSLNSFGLGSSSVYDLQFRDVLRIGDSATANPTSDGFQYIPGALSGLWEGTHRTIYLQTIDVPITSGTMHQPAESTGTSTPASVGSMVFIKPMQCKITEYVCTMSGAPPSSMKSDVVAYQSLMNCFDASGSALLIDGRTYQKYLPQSQRASPPQSTPLYDVILLGEDHSHAWGGYRFWGRVHRDGDIVLRREAKVAGSHQSESDGVWVLTGRFQSPAMILGRWRITGAPEGGASADHGVFSMGRARQ